MSVVPQIIRSRRSSITIQITPQGELVVKAPKFMPQFVIDKFLHEKSDWIEKTLAKVSTRQTKQKTYHEGEEFLFLGITHTLKFVDRIEVSAKNGKLLFPKALVFRIKKELENWYKNKAKEIITRRVSYHAKQMGKEYTSVMFSQTSSKWGTCTHENKLQFNWKLVMAPLIVLDYVVIHELAHTIYKHHQNSFWKEVARFTPAYKQHRKWLNDHAHLLTI